MGLTLKWFSIVGLVLSGVTLMMVSAYMKARLNLIRNRKALPAIDASVEDIALAKKKESDEFAAYELRVRCTHGGRAIPLTFRIEALDEASAARNERYLALTKLMQIGQTIRLRFEPRKKFLGYVVDADVYPQAEPAKVLKAHAAFRTIFLVGGLFVVAGLFLLFLLLLELT